MQAKNAKTTTLRKRLRSLVTLVARSPNLAAPARVNSLFRKL